MEIRELKNRCVLWKESIDQAVGELRQIKKSIDDAKELVREHKKDLLKSQKAQLIAQIVSQETQQQLEYQLNKLVSMALKSVFGDNAYKLRMQFSISRGKTIVEPFFERNGKFRKPGRGTGFGPCDVGSFALRPTLWGLEEVKKIPVFILDEPGRHINDPTRKLNIKFAESISQISRKLEIQIIVVTQDKDLCRTADKVFSVEMTDLVSNLYPEI